MSAWAQTACPPYLTVILCWHHSRAEHPGAITVARQWGHTLFLSRDTLRSQVQSPQELLSQAIVVPSSGGGFALQEVESGSLIEQLGLRAGDVILSANGQALRSTDDIMRAYQGSQGMSQVRLEVSRDGRRVQYLYDIR